MRIVVALPVDVHGNGMVEHVLESEFLEMALNAIDVEVNHYFLERAVVPLEPKIAILSFDPVPGGFGGDVGPVDEAARF